MKIHNGVFGKIPGAPARQFGFLTLIAIALLAAPNVPAGWRDFGYALFTDGDAAILRAPESIFDHEMERFGIVSPGQDRGGGWHEHSPEEVAEAEAADLQSALLNQTNLTREVRDRLTQAHLIARQRFLETTEPWRWRRRYDLEVKEPPAELPIAGKLPAEFADYLAGAVAWHHADTNAAIAAWENLLARPAAERRYKSVWAEFMLGRARLEGEPERAIAHFQRTRALVKEGFPDRLQLAHASYGQEARAHLKLGYVFRATQLYVEQARAGGWADTLSIEWSVTRALREGAELVSFARDPKLRRVVTAALTGNNPWKFVNDASSANRPGALTRWIDALEAEKISDPALAEQLVLATFIHEEYDLTRQWLKRAPQTPVAQWIRARLFIAEGNLSAATALMERLSPHFENLREGESPSPSSTATLLDNLSCWSASGTHAKFHAELGTMRLAQARFQAALNSFLEAEYWGQAAYIAERLLTLDELKTFVDARWKQLGPRDTLDDEGNLNRHPPAPLSMLLARRLTREGRGDEAIRYLPEELQPAQKTIVENLRVAWDESQPAHARADSFIAAGKIVRWHGLELIATELEPDFAVYGGSEVGNMVTVRLDANTSRDPVAGAQTSEKHPRVLIPSAAERKRAAAAPADPMERWHYRYIAADLLWRAAQLLPNQTDQKARALTLAGTWIKYSYPEAADRYYKALVRTCGETEIGQLADARRWFPKVDDDGHLLPSLTQRSSPPVEPEIPLHFTSDSAVVE